MPTYEYACKVCGDHIEVVQSFKDDPLAACPSCGGALRKVFGNIGIVFKGSGFYKTDSRSSGQSRAGTGRGVEQHSTDISSGDGKRSGAGAGAGDAAKHAGSTTESATSTASSGGGAAASSTTSEKAAAGGR